METLVYLLWATVTATLIGALFLAPSSSLGYRPLLSGYTITVYTMILYVALSAAIPIFFNNMTSFWYPSYGGSAMFLGTLAVYQTAIILFVGFYHFFSRRRPAVFVPQPLFRPKTAYFPAVAYLFIAVGLLLKVLYVYRYGGLHLLLVTRSPGITGNLGLSINVDQTTVYVGFFSFVADAAACWLFLNSMRLRKFLILHGVLLTITIGMSFIITPKRDYLIASALAIIVGFGIYVRPLRLSQAPVFLISAVMLSMATLAGRIFLPAYLAGINVVNFARWDLVRTFAVKLLSADVGFFDSTVLAIYGREQVIDRIGGWWAALYRPNIETFYYMIPRVIWPSKPAIFMDISIAFRSIMEGTPLNRTLGGNGVGFVGTSWIYGRLLGLICGMALLGWAASIVDRFLPKMHYASPGRILVFAVSLMVLFHFYRQGSLGWTFLTFFQTGLVFWLASLIVTYQAGARIARRRFLPENCT